MATEPTKLKEAEGESPLEAFKSGKIDIFSLVFLVPESSIPPQFLASYKAAKDAIQQTTGGPQSEGRKRESGSVERIQDALELLLLTHGEGYVQACIEFQRTEAALHGGLKVLESQWFMDLQESRLQQIEQLQALQKAGQLSKEQENLLRDLKRFRDADNDAHDDLIKLAEKAARIREQALVGKLTEKEVLEQSAAVKQAMFERLDKMSPEARAALLVEMKAHNPNLVKEYEDRAEKNPAFQNPPSAPEPAPEKTETIASTSEETVESDYINGIINKAVEPDTAPDISGAKQYGFPTLVSAVNVRESFQSAACSTYRDSATQNLDLSEKPTPSQTFGVASLS